MSETPALPSASQEIAAALAAGDTLLRLELAFKQRSRFGPASADPIAVLVEALAPLLAAQRAEAAEVAEDLLAARTQERDTWQEIAAESGRIEIACRERAEAAERALVEARQERDDAKRWFESTLSAWATPEIFNAVQWAVLYKEERAIRDEHDARLLRAEADRDRLQGVIDRVRDMVEPTEPLSLVGDAFVRGQIFKANDVRAELDRLLTISPGEGGQS